VPKVVPSSEIDGVVIVELDVHADVRGTFVEPWRAEWFPGRPDMVQANHSEKVARSLVGLHYHLRQADYWYGASGFAKVVLYDLRAESGTSGTTMPLELGETERRGIYIPPGVAHGFATRSQFTLWYMVDHYYDPQDELGVAWDDPDLGIDWEIADPILSARDQHNPRLSEIPPSQLPR
jgi:dTDP-4-dehydrorhamnose 3,5-epimerase